MAEPAKTDHPVVTGLEAVAGLFSQFLEPDRGFPWLADRLIDSAIERTVIVVEGIPKPDFSRVLYVLGDPPVRAENPSVFRSLLAFFASVGKRETGTDVNPYGDRFRFTRELPSGPAEVFVDFQNTMGMQRLQIICQPITAASYLNGASRSTISNEPMIG